MVQAVHELKDLWVCGSRLRLEIDVPQRIPGAEREPLTSWTSNNITQQGQSNLNRRIRARIWKQARKQKGRAEHSSEPSLNRTGPTAKK